MSSECMLQACITPSIANLHHKIWDVMAVLFHITSFWEMEDKWRISLLKISGWWYIQDSLEEYKNANSLNWYFFRDFCSGYISWQRIIHMLIYRYVFVLDWQNMILKASGGFAKPDLLMKSLKLNQMCKTQMTIVISNENKSNTQYETYSWDVTALFIHQGNNLIVIFQIYKYHTFAFHKMKYWSLKFWPYFL